MICIKYQEVLRGIILVFFELIKVYLDATVCVCLFVCLWFYVKRDFNRQYEDVTITGEELQIFYLYLALMAIEQ